MKWIDGSKIKDEKSLQKIEKLWSVSLPQSFKKLVTHHNKGIPEEDFFDFEQVSENHFLGFINFDLAELEDKNGILNIYSIYQERLPKNVFPISEDGGGNLICFDYRKNRIDPEIVFWHHEMVFENGVNFNPISFIANSFDDFMKKLYKIEKEPIVMNKEEEDFWNNLIESRKREEDEENI